ncbi:MAG: 4,5-DOPA dioxygenase extradiol, partial [Mobilitalea sp.]
MMPVIFVGHGSPTNAIEDNEYTRTWKQMAASIPKPAAILSVSAHWVTEGTKVSVLEKPKTIHDFYGFEKELYEIEYKVPGGTEIALKTLELLGGIAEADSSWGLDHGTWSVLHVMYPEADIPVFQLSIDQDGEPLEHLNIGKRLKSLRDQNVLIMGSGNIVHNLRILDFSMKDGFDWAKKFDDFIEEQIMDSDFDGICNYRNFDRQVPLSVPTTEHFN